MLTFLQQIAAWRNILSGGGETENVLTSEVLNFYAIELIRLFF